MDSISRMTRLIDRLSRYIVRIIIVLFIIIIVVQELLQFDTIRTFIVPTERWEGTPVSQYAFATHYRLCYNLHEPQA